MDIANEQHHFMRCSHHQHRTIIGNWIIVFIAIIDLANSNYSFNATITAAGNARDAEATKITSTITTTANTAAMVMRLTQRNNHANISELLDNLLRGYDNSIRPGFGGKLNKKMVGSDLL